MDEPVVSVIIPAYNADRFLKETLDSVAQQTYRDFETIVIDDGSTDRTASIAKSYDNVRYHYQVNQGPAAARNTGLGMSRGRYLVFLDADDLWHEEMLDACVAEFRKQPQISAVHTNWQVVDDKGRIVRRKSGWQPWRGLIFERLLVDIALINPAIMWKRQCFEEIGGFDLTPEVNDDWLNWLRIAHRGHQFECLERPLVFYRKHEGNLTLTQSFRVIEWRKRALDLLFAEIDVDPQLRNQAYAQVHWVKSMAALEKSDVEQATIQFGKAVELNESLLWRAETYYAIAHGGGEESPAGILDVGRAEDHVIRFLARVETPVGVGADQRTRKAWGVAYYYLARIAYSAANVSASKARAYLFRAARMWPGQFWQQGRAIWALRILVGRSALRRLRGVTREWA